MQSNADQDGVSPYVLLALLLASVITCFGTFYLLHLIGLPISTALVSVYGIATTIGLSVRENKCLNEECESYSRPWPASNRTQAHGPQQTLSIN